MTTRAKNLLKTLNQIAEEKLIKIDGKTYTYDELDQMDVINSGGTLIICR